MNAKYIFFLIIVLFSFIGCMKRDLFQRLLKRDNITYSEYDAKRDHASLDELVMKNAFWLFHGNVDKSKLAIYNNMIEKSHISDDFDVFEKVPYYTFVARKENKVVGFITYYISTFKDPKTHETKKIGRIHLLCVDSDCRRVGIGIHLVKEVIEFFKKEFCFRAYLLTRPENIKAKSLYYKVGFVESEKTDFAACLYDENPAEFLIKDL
jgi:ribosomal protein S18 acetylase RimI-like enzyme